MTQAHRRQPMPELRETGSVSAGTRVGVAVDGASAQGRVTAWSEVKTPKNGDSSGRAVAIGSDHGERRGNADSLLEHGSVAGRKNEKRALGPFSVSAIGLGAMRLAGPNVFGPPADRDDAIALLRTAVDAGVDHIDTAQYYGPAIVNELIRDALHPYPPGLVLVSKVGARRGRRGEIFADDKPDRLRQGIDDNLRTLETDQIGVVNLRLMRGSGPDSFFDDQLAAMVAARDDGAIRAVGLSNVSLPHLLHALKFTEIACVQNAFHPADRTSQPVLDECTRRGIAFVPFAPLGFGARSLLTDPTLARVAARSGCTPAQACLAWELAVAPNLLLIPGTSSRVHLQENLEAAEIRLSNDAFEQVSQL